MTPAEQARRKVNHAAATITELQQQNKALTALVDADREQITALTYLAEAAGAYYFAFVLGEALAKPDKEIEADFISEVRAFLIQAGDLAPDPADDPSLAARLGK